MRLKIKVQPGPGVSAPKGFSTQTATGLFIGKTHVVATSIPNGKTSFKFVRSAVEPFDSRQEPRKDKPLGKEIVLSNEARAIQTALQKVGFKSGDIAIALSPTFCVTRYFEIPHLAEKELKGAVHFEAARYIPYKLEETFGDFFTKPRINHVGKKMISVSYSAIKKDVINHYYNLLRQRHATPVLIEPVFLSMARTLTAAKVFPTSESVGLIFVEGNSNVNITLLQEGLLYLSHDFLLTDDAGDNQSRFAHEIKTSTEYAFRSWGVPYPKNFYLAGSGEIENWQIILNQGSSEAKFQLIHLPTEKPMEAGTEASAVVPAGLAMRLGQQKSAISDLQLLPAEVRGTNFGKIKKWILWEAMLFLILFAAARFLILEPYASSIQKQVAARAAEASRIPTPYTQLTYANLSMEYERIERRLSIIQGFEKGRLLVYKKLKAIGVTKPQAIWLKSINFELFGKKKKGPPTATETQTAKNPLFGLHGFCYPGDPEREVAVVNEWVETLGTHKEFMEGLKGLTVAELKRSTYLTQQVTEFDVISKDGVS